MKSSHVKFSVSHLTAQAIVFAVVERARSLGVPHSVAVVDANGLVMALCRMAGAPLVSTEVAQSRAFAALFGAPARREALPAGGSRLPRVVSIGAGSPIVLAGRAVGAIGASGGTAEQDLDCVLAGLATLRERAGRRTGGAVEERRAGLDR